MSPPTGGLARVIGPLLAAGMAALSCGATAAQGEPAKRDSVQGDPGGSPAAGGPAPPEALARLVAAYPDALDGVAGDVLLWRDGTRMAIHDGTPAKPHAAWLAAATIADMFTPTYPAGTAVVAPPSGVDPGRTRNAALFAKLYGDCTRGEVADTLVDVVWLPSKWGRSLRVTARHGMADRLRAVSARLDGLPAAFNRYLFPPAGTYICRRVAGEDRLSAHAYGIAIDLALPSAHYWRWDGGAKSGRAPPWRNAYPPEIVAAFEAEGFVWGGRWSHYDTMHFEYRPELIAPVAR